MLIIGLGNVDRGDDAAGVLVAHRLSERGITAEAYTGSTLGLIDIWCNAKSVVVIDTVLSGAIVGDVHMWTVANTALSNEVFRSSTHEFGLADTIELARTLNRLPPDLTIVGIEGRHFEPGNSPSPGVLSGVEKAVAMIEVMSKDESLKPSMTSRS